MSNINPEYASAIVFYYTYWLHYLSVPTIGLFFLVLVLQLDIKRQKELKEAKKYTNLFTGR